MQILDTLVLSIELPPDIVAAINRQTEQYYMIQEYKFRVQREAEESKRKQIEADGIAAFQKTVSQGISDSYLRWRGIEATLQLALSPNAKVVVIGAGKDGLPIILGNDTPAAPAAAAQPAAPGEAPASGAAPPSGATPPSGVTPSSGAMPPASTTSTMPGVPPTSTSPNPPAGAGSPGNPPSGGKSGAATPSPADKTANASSSGAPAEAANTAGGGDTARRPGRPFSVVANLQRSARGGRSDGAHRGEIGTIGGA